jgi:putative selenium metabolism hydrolase
MKSGLAAMIYGAKRLKQSGIPLKGSLCVACVVQEEPCEGLAVRHIIEEEAIRPDWVVLGEPSNLGIFLGHRGRVEFEVKVRGRSAHGSTPEAAENAIYRAIGIVQDLERMCSSLSQDTFLGRGTLAVTEISSTAGSRNVIPDLCTLILDRRLTRGETPEGALREVQDVVERSDFPVDVGLTHYEAVSYTGHVCRQENVFPAWTTDEDHRLVRAMTLSAQKVLGSQPRVGKWAFATDGCYTAGVAGIPTIGFGPAEEQYAHTSDEQVEMNKVFQATQVYAQLGLELLT